MQEERDALDIRTTTPAPPEGITTAAVPEPVAQSNLMGESTQGETEGE